jgi:hypothetical protein
MKNDVLTVRRARYPDELAARLEGSTRGEITEFSMESRRRLAIIAANTSVDFLSFLTLTYPKNFPANGRIVKGHFQTFRKALVRKIGPHSYLWFLEFQRRGAPHFHMFVSFGLPAPLCDMIRKSGRVRKSVQVNWNLQRWACETWADIVGSGDPKHRLAGAAWEVIEHPDGAARYVSKEAYKTFQKVVPKGFQDVGRFWGCSRDVPPPESPVILANQRQMQEIFGAESCDANGNPYPVIFSAAGAYEKIRDTRRDPAKIREWLTSTRSFPKNSAESGQRVATFINGCAGLKPMPIHVSYP